MFNLLKSNLNKVGAILSDEKIQNLVRFFDMLVEYNTHTNLTRIVSPEEAATKHFADSLVGSRFIPRNSKVCDIGSGGGFPSIPLSVDREDCNFTLVDSTGKKVEFLRSVISALPLKNATTLHERAEEMGRQDEYREAFDVVTARAVASLPTLLVYCLPFVKVGGIFLAYKTSGDEIDISQNALSTLGGEVKEVYTYDLGDMGDRRNIFVIKKVSHTPDKYPRGQGKPRSKPL